MSQIRQFDLELAELKRSLVGMGNLVEQALDLAIAAIQHPVSGVRARAKEIENRVDLLDTQIEERCHELIVLQSPMAKDLRLLISATRITSELEQVADLAEGIAKRAEFIAGHQAVVNPPQLGPLGDLAKRMVSQAMDAFVTGRFEQAGGILLEEDAADRMTKECYASIQVSMQATPEKITEYTHLLRAVGHLEHIADIAVSIAEEAVYIYRGHLVLHPREKTLEA